MTDRYDVTLLMVWLVLLAAGVVMVTSASVAMSASSTYHLVKHGVFVIAGLGAFGFVLSVPLRFWEVLHRPCLFVAILLCAFVLAPNVGHEVNGAKRWIGLGFFTLHASEIAKFLVLVYLAGYLARAGESLRDDLIVLLRPLGWISVLLLLVLMEPDFGTTVVLVVLTGGLMFLAGARIRHFLVIGAATAAALALLAILQPYRAERLVTFLDPWSVAFGSGYQLTQALIAFGRGGFFGLGLGEGVQKLFYLPEAHNDFIFAVIAEELGLIGATVLFGLLVFVVLRSFRIARFAFNQNRVFAAYLAYGVGLLLGAQIIINVGVNTGVLPTKGLTLPFISFGGNSLLVCSALVGLTLRVHFEGASVRTARIRSRRRGATASSMKRRAFS